MNKNIDLESAIAAIDEYGYDKKQSSDLAHARNKQQMVKYIDSLDYNLRRLLILQESVNDLVENKKHQLAQQEAIQTYKTKVINLSRKFGITYEEVLEVMIELENQAK